MPYESSTQRPGIAGVGAVTGYGWRTEDLWSGVLSGRSAVVPVTYDNGCTYPVATPDPADGDSGDHPSLYGQAMFAATRQAVSDATERGWTPGARVGLIVAGSIGDVRYRRAYLTEAGGKLRSRDYLGLMPSTAPAMLMKTLGFSGGPVMNIQAACSSANVALALAKMWLATGLASDVIVAGCDFSGTPEELAQFTKMGALATPGEALSVCRPFQPDSKGFVGGEAAASIIISPRVEAPYAALLGGAMAHDPFHPIAINPDLSPLVDLFEGLIECSGASSTEVGYFYTHGTGTLQNDLAEMGLAEKLLAPDVTMIATKPLHGHCQGASAAVENVLAALALERGVFPSVSPGDGAYDRLSKGTQPLRPGLVLKASIGMGGFNAAVLLAPVN